MTDIIRQLRYIQEEYKNDIVSTGRVVISDLARDCANEIERLQAENTRLKAECANFVNMALINNAPNAMWIL